VREILARSKAIAAVIPNRILLALLQPLLALLLIASAAQAEPCLILDERDWTIASSSDSVSTWNGRTDKASVTAQTSSDRDDDDYGFGYLLHSPETSLVIDQAGLIENSRAAYPTAPPSHWPCAAPPTGPPLVRE
jgi:hypothetical protein